MEIDLARVSDEVRAAARGSRDERPAAHLLDTGILPRLHSFAERVRDAAAHERPLDPRLLDEARAIHGMVFRKGVEQLRTRLAEGATRVPLLVRLMIQHTELQAVPWEALCNPAAAMGFLGTSPDLLPVRGVTTDEPWEPRKMHGALRILAVAPMGGSALASLKSALAKRIADGEVDWLEPIEGELATNPWLFDRLRRAPVPHVLHFLGHGGVVDGVPMLRLADVDHEERWLQVELLADQLKASFRGALRLVVLEACKGAMPSAFASAAEILARAGVSAVVAHLWPVKADVASTCSSQLYEVLAGAERGVGDIARALNEARRAILGSFGGSAEAFSPIVYLRGSSGVLFDFKDRRIAPATFQPVAPPAQAAVARDGGHVELTAKLRRVNRWIEVVFLDQHGAEKHRRTLAGALALPDGARVDIEAIVAAFREQRREGIDALLVGDRHIPLGELLTKALLGDRDEQRELFETIFPGAKGRGATCLDSPVHLRLHASPGDADLLLLPWRAMTFERHPLRDHGKWIFSMSAVDRSSRPLELPPDLRVVLFIPERDVAGGSADHAEHMKKLLQHLNPALKTPGRLRHVRYADEARDALEEVCPAVIYWCGHAETQGEQVLLRFDDDDTLPVEELARCIGSLKIKPLIVYLNGCPTGAAALLERDVPVVLAHPAWEGAEAARDMAARFFERLLRDGMEPPAALEEAARISSCGPRCLGAAVWASYPWFVAPPPRSRVPADIEDLMLRLDRHTQRAVAAKSLEGLVTAIKAGRPGPTRALSFLYCGSSADRVDQFADALHGYLAHELAEKAGLLRLPRPLALPEDPGVPTREAVHARLRDAVGARSATIIEKLRGMTHTIPHGKVPVFWLDWGAYPGLNAREVSDDEVVRWQAGLQAELLEHLPDGATALSLLGRQVDKPPKTVERLRKKLNDKKLLSGSIHIKVLQELDKVEADELADFFRENEARLGLALERSPDAVQLIMKRTGGVYDKTVTLLREAMEQGWDIFLLDDRRP